MRLVVQRVKSASVSLFKNDRVVGSINGGYLVLLGIQKGDSSAEVVKMSEKLLKLRIMEDTSGKMNLSICDIKGDILIISQFTLLADTNKGNRPSFFDSEEPSVAKKLYDEFIETLKQSGLKVENGEFGEYMKISAVLDGPVTIIF